MSAVSHEVVPYLDADVKKPALQSVWNLLRVLIVEKTQLKNKMMVVVNDPAIKNQHGFERTNVVLAMLVTAERMTPKVWLCFAWVTEHLRDANGKNQSGCQ